MTGVVSSPRPAAPEERIARELEDDIIFGRLEPGARLVEETLLERFGGSRHFVRQALARLERAGIVVRERNRGATVRAFTADEVREIYEVREMVQRQAALRIPLPAPATLIEKLGQINQQYGEAIRAGNPRRVHEQNDLFHLTLFGACGNAHLLRLVKDYMDVTLAIRAKNLADPARLAVSCEHHELMIKYLGGRDNWLLAELCVDHVQPSKQDYLRRLAEAPMARRPRSRSRSVA